ncbi:T9SS type A sorting domain-containing protein [bacterium]|nr:T9SS type A sorting domain-containing protein [bacterium]
MSPRPWQRFVRALAPALCALGLSAPHAAAGTALAISPPGAVDTRGPRFTLLAPEPGAILIGGESVTLRWSLEDPYLPAGQAGQAPLGLSFHVDGALVHADSLSLAAGIGQPPSFAYFWLVPSLPTENCRWTLTLADAFGNLGTIESEPHRIATDESPADALAPAALSLAPNWPNPFNPATRLRFGLPRAGSPRLTIHDVQGRELARLWDGPHPAGWLELEWRPQALASGVYFARLVLDGEQLTRKLVLLK